MKEESIKLYELEEIIDKYNLLYEFKKILHNPNRIKEYGENILKVIKEKYL